MSQSSRISSSKRKTHRSSRLHQIEADVFQRIVNLKNQKIGLISQLSSTIDQKYRAEDRLIAVLAEKRKEEERIVSKEEYYPVIKKYYQLKDEEEELNRKSHESPHHTAEIEEEIILSILQQKAINDQLAKEIQAHPSPKQKIEQIKARMAKITQKLNQAEANRSLQTGVKPQSTTIGDLLSYIEREEEQKRSFYSELADYQQDMQQMRTQNERIQEFLNYNYNLPNDE